MEKAVWFILFATIAAVSAMPQNLNAQSDVSQIGGRNLNAQSNVGQNSGLGAVAAAPSAGGVPLGSIIPGDVFPIALASKINMNC